MAKRERRAWLLLGAFIAYLLVNHMVISWVGNEKWYTLGVRQLVYATAIVYFIRQQKPKLEVSIKQQPFMLMLTIMAALLYATTYFMLGFIDGYGRNPFNTSPVGILMNLYLFLPWFAVTELLRVHFINNVRKERQQLAVAAIVLIYTLGSFTPTALTSVFSASFRSNVEFLGSRVLTEVAKNILLTNFARMGGFRASMLMRVSFECIFFFLPVLPNLKWITTALLDNLFPVYTLILIREALHPKENRDRIVRTKENPYSWAITYLGSIAIVWFAVGLFPIFPTVILTGSMEPVMYPGDVAVMEKIEGDRAEIGDVIQFWAEDYFIIHRVIAIEDGMYLTKGDNNNAADSSPVDPGQVKGRVLFRIPKIGKPVLFTRSKTNADTFEQVEEEYETGKEPKD